MRRIVLIANPFATNVTERGLRAIEATLAQAGSVETRLTERRGHATELAQEAAGADALVVFGGDGVVNEALNGLPGGVRFGALPGGGTSVFARALGLDRDAAVAARQLAESIEHGASRRISLGRVAGRRFAFSAGIGLDAATVRRVDALGRRRDGRRPGDLAYTYAGPVPIHFAPGARFELGLDVIAPVRISPRSLPRLLQYVVRGRGVEHAPDVLYAHDLDRIEVMCDRPLPLQVDGEDLGDVERAVFEAERDAVDILS